MEFRRWVNWTKWRNCWMVLTLTSEMSLSWPPRYTSIHELNKIINSPNILSLSYLVLASLQELNSCSWIRICTVILHTVTDSADSRFDVNFIWHSNDVYKTWYLNLYEMNGWETSFFYSRVPWIFVRVIRTPAISFAHIELRVKSGEKKNVVLLNAAVVQFIKGSKK